MDLNGFVEVAVHEDCFLGWILLRYVSKYLEGVKILYRYVISDSSMD